MTNNKTARIRLDEGKQVLGGALNAKRPAFALFIVQHPLQLQLA